MEGFVKGQSGFAIVENDSAGKVFARVFTQFAQTSKILWMHGCRRFHLDAGKSPSGAFQHDVDFVGVPVAIMEKLEAGPRP